jgi:hypothetical protein
MWNTRVRLMYLVNAVRDLAAHGPAKPEAEHGLDEVKEEYEGAQVLALLLNCNSVNNCIS